MNCPEGTDRILRGVPLFAGLTDEECSELRRKILFKSIRRNEVILLEEETASFMYIVFSGAVKAVKIGGDGRENILAIHEEGDFFGEMALLDGRTSPATVIALEAAEIGLIAKREFDKYIAEHPAVLRAIIALLCDRLREAWATLQILTSGQAEKRVRVTLGRIANRCGAGGRDGVLVRTRLTHQDIAHCASVSRETVSRLMEKFRRAGEIEIPGRRVILFKPSFFEKMPAL
jgi:CRP/FNR family transcriptional regulator